MTTTHNVRVSFVSRGYGIALALDEEALAELVGHEAEIGQGEGFEGQIEANPDENVDFADGVLHVSNSAVTLELPAVDGGYSVMAWDPAEVEWSSLLAS